MNAWFFVDTLEVTGEFYLIPIEHRAEWDDFDIRCENAAEILPVPTWAQHIPDGLAGLRWIEFSNPKPLIDIATPACVAVERQTS